MSPCRALMASLRAIPAASLLICGGTTFGQQVISSNTPSGFTAADGDITVNTGVTVGGSGFTGTALTVNNVNVGAITNNGTLQTSNPNGTALYLLSTASRVTVTNTGTMRSKGGLQLYSVADVTNTGTMFGSDKGIIVTSGASGSTITNNGSLNASGQSFAAVDILSGATLASLSNGSGRTLGGFVPISNNGTITLLVNDGTLRSGHSVPSSAIGGGGTITTLVNRGTITPARTAAGIANRVVNLANAQGGNSPLTISSAPTSYSIIINSPTSFGRLRPQGFSGTMGFDVYAGSSIVTGYYYSSVLQDVTAANLANTTGTFEGVSWSLSLLSGSTTTWDLCFGTGACSYTLSSNILSGQTYSSANVGSSVNRAFDGGTLQMASSATVSGDFTLTGNGGTIDQRGNAAVFSGSFSNANAGTAGKLTIRNTGTAEQGSVTLNAANTHTGGIDVLPGAKLVINSPLALGSGTLNLIGSATVPSALGTTQTMTISNPITVSGDPVFDVAAGTTLTISSPITDGGSPGDVVVRGTGLLSLTAVNTYSGLTTVDPGANLALNGVGSIANTSLLTNNGRIDLTGAADTVVLGGNVVQSATGQLVSRIAPAGAQRIDIAGSASLDGSLTLQAAAGPYRIGRYRIIDAGNLSGRFASFSSNLASQTALGHALGYDSTGVFIDFTPSVSATLAGVSRQAEGLARLFSLQATVLDQNNRAPACDRFDARGLCVSSSVRRTRVQGSAAPSGQSAAQVGLAYRATPHLRYGGHLDWMPDNPSTGSVRLRSLQPGWGVHGQWNHAPDGSGWSVRASVASVQHRLELDRSATDLTEAASGRTRLAALNAELLASHARRTAGGLRLTPFAGLRYGRTHMAAYTESEPGAVSPLSFDALGQRAWHLATGVNLQQAVGPRTVAGFGLDLQHRLGRESTSLSGRSSLVGAETFSAAMPTGRHTRAGVSAQLAYRIDARRSIGLQVAWQQQAVGSSTLGAALGFQAGF